MARKWFRSHRLPALGAFGALATALAGAGMAGVGTAQAQGAPACTPEECVGGQRQNEAESEAKVRAEYQEILRRDDSARQAEQEKIDTYNRRMEEHRSQVAEHQRQAEAAAEAQRRFEEQQAQYEREYAAWEAQTNKRR